MKWMILTALTTLVGVAQAADMTRRSVHDHRIRYVTYKPDDVVEVFVRRGVVTRLILEPEERITQSGTGFSAPCENDEFEWCIRAEKDTNQVWVKPRAGATHNNLELATTRRDYSIRFNVLGDDQPKKEMYRVIFQYPVPKTPWPSALAEIPSASALTANLAALQPQALANDLLQKQPQEPENITPARAQVDEPKVVRSRLKARPDVRNLAYSMEILGGGQLIAPSVVFDDGRFTYLKFPNNREIPAPFVIGADKQEARVNFHVEGDLIVIQKVVPQIVLRLGDAVVGIWNDAFDPDGISTPSGTTVPNVRREVVSSQRVAP